MSVRFLGNRLRAGSVIAERGARPSSRSSVERASVEPRDTRRDDAPAPLAEDSAEYLLKGWLEHHAALTPEQRSQLLSSALSLIDETRRALADARHQLEFERRNASSVRDMLESRLREALDEERRLRELESTAGFAAGVDGDEVGIVEARAAYEALEQRHAETVARLEALDAEHAGSAAEHRRRQVEAEDAAAASEALERQHAEARRRLADLEAELAHRDEERAAWEEERTGWLDERERFETDSRSAVAGLEALERRYEEMHARIAALDAEREQWLDERERFEVDGREAAAAHAALEQLHRQASERLLDLGAEREAWIGEREQLDADARRGAAERVELEQRLGAAVASQRALDAERTDWVAERERHEARAADAAEARKELERRHEEAGSRLAELEAEREQWEIERAQREARSLELRADQERRHEQMGARLAELERTLARWADEREQREDEARRRVAAVSELEREHEEAKARLFEIEFEFALERERWADERARFESQVSEAVDSREWLERDHARVRAERDRLRSAKRALEDWLESMLQRHAVPDVSRVLSEALPALAAQEPAREPDRAAAPGEAGAAPAACSEVDTTDAEALDAAVDVTAPGRPERAVSRSGRRARVGAVHAVLMLDDVEHLHGCVDADEIPLLVREFHRIDWVAAQRVAMGERGDHPVLGGVGMPVTEFLFGVVPDFLLDIGELAQDSQDGSPELAMPEAIEAQFRKLTTLHGVLNDFIGVGLAEGALALPPDLAAAGTSALHDGSEPIVDPLTALGTLYSAIDEIHESADADGQGVRSALDWVAVRSAWSDVDGARLDQATQRKLLYLLMRLANSFNVLLFETFVRVQQAQR